MGSPTAAKEQRHWCCYCFLFLVAGSSLSQMYLPECCCTMTWCFRVSVILAFFFKFAFFSSSSRFLRHQCDVQLRRRAQQIQEELVRDSFILYRCCVVKKLVLCVFCVCL